MPDQASDKREKKAPPRSPEEIQAEIEETRQRLAANLNQLKAETQPKALAEKAKEKVTGIFMDPATGSLRTERVAAVAAVVVGLIVIRKGFKSRAHKRQLKRLGEVVWVPVPKQSVNAEFAPVARVAAEIAPPEPSLAITAG